MNEISRLTCPRVLRCAVLSVSAASLSLFAGGCATTESASTATQTGSSTAVRTTAGMHRVPLTVTGQGSMLVTVNLNGKDVSLILDTGAQATVIDLRIATELGVPLMPGQLYSVGVGAGRVAARQGAVVTLDIAGFKAKVAPTLQDFSTLTLNHLSRGGKPIVGLLGFDVLRSYGAIIDVGEPALYLRN